MSNPNDLDERLKNWEKAGQDLVAEYTRTEDKMDEATKNKYRETIAKAKEILDDLRLRK